MTKNKEIDVKGTRIAVIQEKDGDFFISDWLRNRNTVEFLGVWESVNNPDFNYGEFATIRNQAGLNNYKISVKEWTEKTNAIGVKAKAGRYGGTYAHVDIALEFGMWISAEFKVYLIQEYKRLKQQENDRHQLDWNLQRTLAKVNYIIHTDAIKERLIPGKLTAKQTSSVYASEADLLNMALFGTTASNWREENQEAKGNMRDYATLEQLVVLSNLESINALLIRHDLNQSQRLKQLNQIAITQMTSLVNNSNLKNLTK
ncbi:MAG: KilA-N domain-containing protein [Bacteroidales bacterium]|nr:KilA-N domain-containing protein [Bacteroidales bacterium]